MKKLIALAAFLTLTTSVDFLSARNTATPHRVVYVYLCDSETAHVYHSTKDCRGLRNCTHKIIKVTLDDAVNKYNRRACKICE